MCQDLCFVLRTSTAPSAVIRGRLRKSDQVSRQHHSQWWCQDVLGCGSTLLAVFLPSLAAKLPAAWDMCKHAPILVAELIIQGPVHICLEEQLQKCFKGVLREFALNMWNGLRPYQIFFKLLNSALKSTPGHSEILRKHVWLLSDIWILGLEGRRGRLRLVKALIWDWGTSHDHDFAETSPKKPWGLSPSTQCLSNRWNVINTSKVQSNRVKSYTVNYLEHVRLLPRQAVESTRPPCPMPSPIVGAEVQAELRTARLENDIDWNNMKLLQLARFSSTCKSWISRWACVLKGLNCPFTFVKCAPWYCFDISYSEGTM